MLLIAPPLHAQLISNFSSLETTRTEPANVSGREFVYDYKTDTIVVRGNALLTQGETTLKADELDYARPQREVRAYGKVHLIDPEIELSASKADLNMSDETGSLSDAKLSAKNSSYRLAGSEITKLEGQHYSIRDGFFTTCGCESGAPSWSMNAGQMDVHLGATGTARDARFNILGCPVIPLPYAVFPANSERSSGLLAPRMGESHLRGFQYMQPVYFVINKNSDATVAIDEESSQRIGLLSEYRLQNGLDDYFRVNGAFFDESIRSNSNRLDIVDPEIADPHIPVERYGLIGMTREHLTPDLTVFGDTIAVSDSLYLREMNLYTLSRGYGSNYGVMRDTVSHFGLLQSFDNAFVRLQGDWTEDLIQQQSLALQSLPELLVSGRQDLGHGLAYSDYDMQAVNFWRSDGVSGLRFDLNPRATVPWRLGDYLMGYGTVGGRETIYDTSGHDINVIPVGSAPAEVNNNGLTQGILSTGGVQTRELFYAGAGVSSVLEKVYDLNWEGIEKIKHTIEPLATYNYVPIVSQSQLPLFDETDRINPRSLVTYGMVSRLFVKSAPQPAAGEEHAAQGSEQESDEESDEETDAAEPQGYTDSGSEREAARLSLLQAYDLRHATVKGGTQMSDVEASATLFPTSYASFGSTIDYDPPEEQISSASAQLSLRPPWAVNQKPGLYMGRALTGPFLQVMYNFVGGREASHTFAVRAYYELLDRFAVYYAPVYDFANKQMVSVEYGVRLKSPCNCWAMDFGLTDTINPSEVQFQFQLTLGGLGSMGHNPFGRSPFRDNSSGTGVLPSSY